MRLESNRQSLDAERTFYSDLYTVRAISNAEIDLAFDSLIPENVLTAELQEKCEGLLSKDECFRAVKLMKRNKSPGLDGISIEF